MPRYFFHIHDGEDQPDTEGVELPGPAEARAEAVVATGEALKDLEGAFWQAAGVEWRMTVTDWQGNSVCVISVTGARPPLG
jgi:hypothetical protein